MPAMQLPGTHLEVCPAFPCERSKARLQVQACLARELLQESLASCTPT